MSYFSGSEISVSGFIFLTIIAIQLGVIIISSIKDHQRRKKQATFEFINSAAIRDGSNLFKINEKYGSDIVDMESYSKEDIFYIKKYLNGMERICAGVNSNVFDYDTLRKIQSGSMIKNHRRFEQYIQERQKESSTLYSEFDCVVAKLKRDRKKKSLGTRVRDWRLAQLRTTNHAR